MERPRFMPQSIKFSPEAQKKLDVTEKEKTNNAWFMNLNRKEIYAGTANPRKVSRSRAKNKVARKSRVKNRK